VQCGIPGCESKQDKINDKNKTFLSSFLGVLIDLVIELLDLIIKPFDNQTESWD
jgi:hypothetical protein